MQIIHPYRHNTVTVCIFMPFDWRTTIASLLSYLAIKKTLTRTSPDWSNSCPILGLVEKDNIWGRCSPILMRVPACPTAAIMLHVQETGLGHQCRRGGLNLHLETLWPYWKGKGCKTAHRSGGCLQPEDVCLPLQYFQNCSSPTWQYLWTALRQVNNEKVFSASHYS